MPGGVPGGVHLVGGVEGGEVDLEPVVVLPVELHLFKPVAPQDLTGQVGRPEHRTESQSESDISRRQTRKTISWSHSYDKVRALKTFAELEKPDRFDHRVGGRPTTTRSLDLYFDLECPR